MDIPLGQGPARRLRHGESPVVRDLAGAFNCPKGEARTSRDARGLSARGAAAARAMTTAAFAAVVCGVGETPAGPATISCWHA